MRFSFQPEQLQFAEGLRELLNKECAAAHVRAVWDAGTGHDPHLWSLLADMGVLGMMIPADAGGMDGTFVDAVLLLEELGRSAVPGPVVETMVIGAVALGQTPLAAGVADGSLPVAAAVLGEGHIAHGAVAGAIVVGNAQHLRLIRAGDATLHPLAGLDPGRNLTVLAADTASEALSVAHAQVVNAGALGTAAYLLGLSERMLHLAGDYARDRRQFGQPIGAFQAVKHLMADALLKVEFARPAVYRAAWSVAAGSPDADRDVSMAKALANEAATKTARSALQVHGAIGYTWECDLQLYMKKAWALTPAWGGTSMHRRRVADSVLGPRG